MTFDLYILDKVGNSILNGIDKGLSPILFKVPILIILIVGFLIGFFLVGNMDFVKTFSKTKIALGLIVVIILLLLRGGGI